MHVRLGQRPDSERSRPADLEARATDGTLTLTSDGTRAECLDEILVLTGLRPGLSFRTELRLAFDDSLQAPAALAPLIDPNQHCCGTFHPHGGAELSHSHPEKDVHLIGMKSYGLAPTFLAMTGYEQVRSVTAHLAGGHDAATASNSPSLRLASAGVPVSRASPMPSGTGRRLLWSSRCTSADHSQRFVGRPLLFVRGRRLPVLRMVQITGWGVALLRAFHAAVPHHRSPWWFTRLTAGPWRRC